MGKLRSNRVKRTPQVSITPDRYQFLGLEQAEPNLGDAEIGPSSAAANPIKLGRPYQLYAVGEYPGERYWAPAIGGGTSIGVISVYANGLLPSSLFQNITGLNFVGTGVTIESPPVQIANGVGVATVRFTVTDILNRGEVGQVLYNTPSGYAYGADGLYYVSGNVGIGSTIPKQALDVSGNGIFGGTVTATKFIGNIEGTFTGTASTAIDVIGGIASVTSLSVSGLSTFGGNLLPSTTGLSIGNPGNRWENFYVNNIVGNLTGAASSVAVYEDLTDTTRYIPFVDVTTGVSSVKTSSSLTFIPSTARLGIGTNNPGEALQVDGNIRVGISTTSNYIAFRGTYNDGVDAFGGDQNTGDELIPYTHTFIGERIYDYSERGERSELLLFKGDNISVRPNGPDRIRLAAGEIRFDAVTRNTHGSFEEVGISTALITRMVLTSSGNLGIGTTNPSSKLHVQGTAQIQANTGVGITQQIWTQTLDSKDGVSTPFSLIATSDTAYEFDATKTTTGPSVDISPGDFPSNAISGNSYLPVVFSHALNSSNGNYSPFFAGVTNLTNVAGTSSTARVSGVGLYNRVFRNSINDNSSSSSNQLVGIYNHVVQGERLDPSAVTEFANASWNVVGIRRATANNVFVSFNVLNVAAGTNPQALVVNGFGNYSTCSIGNTVSTAATVTNYYGYYVDATVVGSNSLLSNYYGLYLAPPSTSVNGTITNRYSIYSPDASSPMYHAGNLGIGTTNPQATLDVGVGSVYISNGDTWLNGTHYTFNTRNNRDGFWTNGGLDGESYYTNVGPGGPVGFRVKIPGIGATTGTFGAIDDTNLYVTMSTRHDGTEGITDFRGRVGIGTTAPTSTLHVQGTANIQAGIGTTESVWYFTSDKKNVIQSTLDEQYYSPQISVLVQPDRIYYAPGEYDPVTFSHAAISTENSTPLLRSFNNYTNAAGITSNALVDATGFYTRVSRNSAADVSYNTAGQLRGILNHTIQGTNVSSSTLTSNAIGIHNIVGIRKANATDVIITKNSADIGNSPISIQNTFAVNAYGSYNEGNVGTANTTATGIATLTNYYGYYSQPRLFPNGRLTNYYGVYLATPEISAGGTLTNSYSIYSPDVSSPMYHAGNLGIGTTNPTEKLTVSGTVLADGFISVGNTTPIQISLVGNKLTFTASGIGSTTLTLF
jgi:hypothetical protein